MASEPRRQCIAYLFASASEFFQGTYLGNSVDLAWRVRINARRVAKKVSVGVVHLIIRRKKWRT